MDNISIICVYNDQSSLTAHLLESLKKQTMDPELILLDNRKHEYASAAQALNAGAQKATKDYLVFMHQDVELEDPNTLSTIYQILQMYKKTVIGAAGIRIKEKGVFSNMTHGVDHHWAGANRVSEKTTVDALDECLIACPKDLLSEVHFDEIICNGWDLYGVDFCYQANLHRYEICVLPLCVWHVSPGKPRHAFYACARKMRKKYHHVLPYLQTCCITVPVSTKWYGSVLLYLLEGLHAIRGSKV